jgi:hypothetical protein
VAKSLQLKHAIQVYLLLTWLPLAYAAEMDPLVVGLESIPPRAVAYVVGLASVGGIAGTLTKMCKPDTAVRSLPLEIFKDIFASLVAGMLAFFFMSWSGAFVFWATAIAITMAGYGGSKVLDLMLVDGVMPWFRNLIQRVFNLSPTPPKDAP